MTLRTHRKYLVLLASLALLVGAYTAFGFLGVPRLLKSQLQAFAAENYGRPVSVGTIRFNPFTLKLQIQDFSLPDDDRRPLLAFQRLFVAFNLASIWRRGASFRVIELDRPYARALIRADGSLNLADLAKPLAQSAPPAGQKADAPLRLFIDRLSVHETQVDFEDRTHAAPFRAQLRPISFELRDFSTTGATGNRYELRGTSSAGEHFNWSGTFSLEPLASRGRFDVTQLQARTLWSYLRDSLGFEITRGVIGLAGDYRFTTATPKLTLAVNLQRVEISQLGIKPRDGDSDYLDLGHVRIENSSFDVSRQRATIGKVKLTGAEVRAWRDVDGHINLQELTAARSIDTVATVRRTSATRDAPTPWTLAAPDIEIAGLKAAVEDRLVEPRVALTLEPVDLRIQGFTTSPDAQLQLDADVHVADSGQLEVRGTVAPDSGVIKAQLKASDIDLATLQPYIAKYTQMTLLSGLLSVKLQIDRAAGGAIGIEGETTVAKLRTIDNALRQDFIKWDLLRASGIEFRSQPAGVRVATIVMRAPYARVIIAADQSVNLSKVLSATSAAPPPAQATAPTTPTKEPPMRISIGTVKIDNGAAKFADFWIQPNYGVSLEGLGGTIVGLSSDPGSRATVALEGKVDRYAPASIRGELNLLSASLFTDIKVAFNGVDMTSVTPYAGRFAGYKIQKGKLSVDVAYRVENRKLEAEQHFVIDQLQLGERVASPDAVRLPLRLAVALLKDRNGVIDVGLPVSGSLDDPKFRLGPLIWKAVIGLLTKVATAPFALLGRLFGGGEELNQVDFPPGEAALDAAGQEKMAALLKAMKERPHLQLDVPMTYSPELDRPVLAATKLNEELLQAAQQQPAHRKHKETPPDATALADPATRFDLLVAQYHQQFGAQAPLPPAAASLEPVRRKGKAAHADLEMANAEIEQVLAERAPVSDGELEQLGKARANAVQDALLAGGEIDASRVFVIAAAAKPAVENKIRLELSLK